MAIIDKPNLYFNTALYTGNYSTNNITSLDFQPDLVWIKKRSAAESNILTDVVRGTGGNLYSNSTSAEDTGVTTGVTSFNSDGFSLGANNGFNQSGATFVAWNWKANGSGSLNEVGSIDSTVSANTTSGFSIVKFTASGSGDQTIGHGLGVTPKMVITKVTSTTGPWNTYNENLNSSAPEDYYIVLESTNASASDSPGVFGAGMTSSTIGVGVGVGFVSGQDYIAYCFADVKGFSKMGSYTGNGNADGTFIYTGFKPAFIMTKNSSAGSTNWSMMDNKRFGYNVTLPYVYANTSGAEQTDQNVNNIDILSNGFKCRESDANRNASGASYIYMAFAENPFVTSTGVPACAR